MEYPGEASSTRYAKWFDAKLGGLNRRDIAGTWVVFLSGMDCYALRCSYLHQGSDDITTQKKRETLEKFHVTTMNAHRVRSGGKFLMLNVYEFCREMSDAVDAWATAKATDPAISAEIAELLTIHTSGFSPAPGIEIHVMPHPECSPPDVT
jgi:hypothetical protein